MATLTVMKLNYGTYTAAATPLWTGLNVANTSMASASASGDKFANDGRTFFFVENLGGTACIVTFKKQIVNDEGFAQDLNVTVALTSGRRMIGPFNTQYNNSSGQVEVSYTFTTTVYVAAISLAESGV